MKLHFLQATRAIAAWLVVTDHALLDITHNDPQNPLTLVAWRLGSAGVAVFFVISGFIMVHISWETFGRHGAAHKFLERRIARIVPLYWVATFAALVYHRFSGTHGANAGSFELLQSLFFIPSVDPSGRLNPPIVPQGWTLSYEMIFYIAFALVLPFRRHLAVATIAIGFVTLTLLSPLLPPGPLAYLAAPIVLWFVVGVAMATVWHLGRFRESCGLARSCRFLELFGDASYSTYLLHGLVLTVITRIWAAFIGSPSLLFLPIGLATVTVAGLLVHMLIELPILRVATNLRSPRPIVTNAMLEPGRD